MNMRNQIHGYLKQVTFMSHHQYLTVN
jgi:hypothetical protein